MPRLSTLASRQCHYCERRATTRDHIVPRSLLRQSLPPYNHGHIRIDGIEIWNLVPACARCNGFKGDKRSDCECAICSLAWDALMPDADVEIRKVIEMATLEGVS